MSVFTEIASGEDTLTMDGVAKAIAPVHLAISTICRWVTKGIQRPGGLVKLEAARIGRKLLTTRRALARFLAAINDQPEAEQMLAPTKAKVPASRQQEIDRAMAELRAAGV